MKIPKYKTWYAAYIWVFFITMAGVLIFSVVIGDVTTPQNDSIVLNVLSILLLCLTIIAIVVIPIRAYLHICDILMTKPYVIVNVLKVIGIGFIGFLVYLFIKLSIFLINV